MYLEIVKTDFLTLDGAVTSFTLTPPRKTNGTNKIRVDSAFEFISTREHKNKTFGGHIIYNFEDCNLETTTTPPNRNFINDSTENAIYFEYKHMDIPLGASKQGNAGRWNLILPEGWRLTELYLSDPYHREEDVKKKKQFKHTVYWDTQNLVQLIEMDLRTRRGSFSFIVKGKALNITTINGLSQIDFTPSTDSSFGLSNLNNLRFGINKLNVLDKINKVLELKPNFAGLGININELIKLLSTKAR